VAQAFARYPQAHYAKLTVTATNGSGYVKRLKGALGAGFELVIGALRLIFSRTRDHSPSLPFGIAEI
jgi:hypothetical protein